METKAPSLKFYLLIFIAITVMNIILAPITITEPFPGVSTLYIAVAFMIPFAMWFRAWGVVAAYIGCFIGAGMLSGIPLHVNIYWSLADVWQVLIPLVAFMTFKSDIGLSSKKDWIIFLLFGWFLNNLIGALWGTSALIFGGLVSWSEFNSIFLNWFLVNLGVTIVITPILLKLLTPYIRKAGINMSGFWS